MSTLNDLAGHFAALRPDLVDPEHVRERCAEISEEFVALLAEHHIAARVISGVRFGEDERFPGVRLMMAGHYAVLVADEETDVVYDWTAHQFDPETPVPLVVRLGEWRETWSVLGEA